MQENEVIAVTETDRYWAGHYCEARRHNKEALATLVAAVRQQAEDAMRERCAVICDDLANKVAAKAKTDRVDAVMMASVAGLQWCATAIRAATLSKDEA